MLRLLSLLCFFTTGLLAVDRPNILWLTSEDNGPHYGCYGDTYATTPNIDALAAKGIRFEHCWSNAPVCAPARTCLISGRWAPADAAEHMRSSVSLPEGHQMYPQFLRAAGYYCSNNKKEDYNLQKPTHEGQKTVWDDSSAKAHWKNRKPGQPFFAVFNNQITHESQIRRQPHQLIHDPAKAPVPPFQPDTPEVRHDWAQYYDNITLMDTQLGKYLDELEKAGLAEDTIIMHYGDHGPGMPRFKRWPYNSGLRVGLVMYFPEKWKHLAPKNSTPGGVNTELVSFIDLPATLLSIAGVQPPDYFQGRAICGPFAKDSSGFNHGFRGRMDERYDLVRSTTDGRYVYIRNYMPQLPYGQFLNYMFQQASTRIWKERFDAGTLPELQTRFWKPKPAEEFYDLQTDPWETVNLVDSAEHQETKQRLATVQREWLLQVKDLGFIPEGERQRVAKDKSPADVFTDLAPVLEIADLATNNQNVTAEKLAGFLGHKDAAVRYWAVQAHLTRDHQLSKTNAAEFEKLLNDPSPSVATASAEALLYGTLDSPTTEHAVKTLLKYGNVNQQPYFVALEAMNVLDRWQKRLPAWSSSIQALPGVAPETVDPRLKEYVARLHQHILHGDVVQDK
jgi:arylsulfatase A-like enzyme